MTQPWDHNEEPMPLRPHLPDDVRLPFNHGYTATEIMFALPASSRVDTTALPESLQAKVRLHGEDLANIDSRRGRTTRQRGRTVQHAPSRTLTLAVGGVTAAAGISLLALAVTHQLGTRTALHIAMAAAATLAVHGMYRRARARAARQPAAVYTPAERLLMKNALIDWPAVPEELDTYPNHEVLQRQWHSRWTWRIEPGAAALVWREARLVAVANLIGRDIRTSKAWRSDLFDVHKVRIDLDQTLAEIASRGHRVWRAHANLVPPTNADPNGIVARRNEEICDAAERAWVSLVELVVQLQKYKTELEPIEAVVAEIEAYELSRHRTDDKALRQLNVDAVGNEYASGDVSAAAAEVDELNADLATRLKTLSHALAATTNVLTVAA